MKKVALANLVEQSVSHDASIKKKVIFQDEEIPHITQVAHTLIAQGEKTKPHTHSDMYEIFYIESGEINARIDDKEITLSAGETLCIQPGENHEFENKSQNQVAIFYFGIKNPQ